MSKKSQETSPSIVEEPRPAAAYLLGGHSRMLKGWINAADRNRHYSGLQTNLVICLNEMDAAVVDLKDTIEAQVGNDLREAIRNVKRWFGEDPYFYFRAIERSAVICSEADRALPRSHPFFGWYDFGCVVGSCWQTIAELEEGESLPDLRILQEMARQLLDGVGDKVPVLPTIVQSGETLAERPAYGLFTLVGKGDFEESDEGNIRLAELWMFRLYRVIHSQLGTLTRAEENADEKPVWDEARSVLFWRGEVIREYTRDPAENQVELIAAFHRAGWPLRIPNPFTKTHPTRPKTLGNTIYEFNRTVVKNTIRFAGDGSRDVRWEPVRKRR